jgi:hypothetical protein
MIDGYNSYIQLYCSILGNPWDAPCWYGPLCPGLLPPLLLDAAGHQMKTAGIFMDKNIDRMFL